MSKNTALNTKVRNDIGEIVKAESRGNSVEYFNKGFFCHTLKTLKEHREITAQYNHLRRKKHL